MKFVVYSFLAFIVTCPVNFGQAKDAKRLQEASGEPQQGGERITEGALRGISIPAYRSLSNTYPGIKKPLKPHGWFLEVEVSGGLTGTRKEYILITSEGNITVDTLEGHRNLELPEEVAEMDRLIKRAQPNIWSTTEPYVQTVSLCQECYKTTLTLYRRQGDETQLGYQAYWDQTTTSRLIAEVGEISREAERIKERALRP